MENAVNITINESKTRAYIQVNPDSHKLISEDLLRDRIKDTGIKHGLIEETIKAIIRSKSRSIEKQLLASSTEPEVGKKGSKVYLIREELNLKKDENGRVDFYDLGLIKTVKKGDKIVKIIPPTNGKPGVDIFGNELQGRPGKKVNVSRIIGEGVVLDEKKRYIISKREGCYKRKGEVVSVVEVVEVDGDLNFSIGNINTVITIIIKGDVRYGFIVKTKSDLLVNGVIEDATIEVGDNIICKSGIVRGKFPVKAGNSIRTKYIVSRDSVSAESVNVEGAIFDSNVFSCGKIMAKRIVGGMLRAKHSIISEELGNEKHTKTIVEIGLSSQELYEMSEYYAEIKFLQEEINNDKKLLNHQRLRTERFLKEKEELIRTAVNSELIRDKFAVEREKKNQIIDKMRAKIRDKRRKLTAIYEKFNKLKELKENPTSSVIVKGYVYPNVIITLNTTITYKVQYKMKNVTFKINQNFELAPFNN